MNVLVIAAAVLVGTGVWLWVLRRYDRVEPEAIRLLVRVAVLGGIASVSAAAVLNELVRLGAGISPAVIEHPGNEPVLRLLLFSLGVGIVEEVCKASVAVFVTRRFGDLDEPVDAMIYAMTVALGFGAFENVVYALQYGHQILLVRFLWPVPAHMAYAALWGYGWAYARFARRRRPFWQVLLPFVLGAGAVHAVGNLLLFFQSTTTTLLSLALLATLAILADRRLQALVAESPFLEPGECPNCRYLNPPDARRCLRCGESLSHTDLFVSCPCGLAKVNRADDLCPYCGRLIGNDADD